MQSIFAHRRPQVDSNAFHMYIYVSRKYVTTCSTIT